jgi:hypothetical protein
MVAAGGVDQAVGDKAQLARRVSPCTK